jgi:hypothetical protein
MTSHFSALCVGDEAAVGMRARARRMGKFLRQQTGGAGFRDVFEKPEQIPGELFDIRHSKLPGAGFTRRPAFALRHLLRRDYAVDAFA